MIRRMIDEVAKHLAERVDVFPAAGRPYDALLVETPGGRCGKKRAPLRFDAVPPLPDGRERAQVGSLWNRGVRFADPAMQPQLFRPHDVRERAMDPAVTTLEIAEILLVRQLGDRLEDDAVRPAVVVE